MDVILRPATDKVFAEALVKSNMRDYYARYAITWDSAQFARNWQAFESFELIRGVKRVGLLCLEYDDQACYIRDLQVAPEWRGQGIGTAAIASATAMTRERGLSRLRLKVFRDNPATRLYRRSGFAVVREDTDFYWMESASPSRR